MIGKLSTTGRCLILAVVLQLAACAVTSEGQNGTLNADPDKALVIVGYGFTGQPLATLFGTRCPIKHTLGYTDTLVVDISRLEPDPTGLFDSISVSDGRCASMTPDEPIGYNFLYLPPGLYSMNALVPFGRLSFRSDKIKYRLFFPSPLKFRARAGDVIYLGDVIASVDSTIRANSIPDGLPNHLELRRTDHAAKAALAKRGGPVDKFRFQPFLR